MIPGYCEDELGPAERFHNVSSSFLPYPPCFMKRDGTAEFVTEIVLGKFETNTPPFLVTWTSPRLKVASQNTILKT